MATSALLHDDSLGDGTSRTLEVTRAMTRPGTRAQFFADIISHDLASRARSTGIEVASDISHIEGLDRMTAGSALPFHACHRAALRNPGMAGTRPSATAR